MLNGKQRSLLNALKLTPFSINENMYTMLFSVMDFYFTMQQSNITDFRERILLKVY